VGLFFDVLIGLDRLLVKGLLGLAVDPQPDLLGRSLLTGARSRARIARR
jgi:hypothetical protein